ncbi:MAG: hypothetical protein ACYCW6_23855, partial [Candidatus Xenobia bacterium]
MVEEALREIPLPVAATLAGRSVKKLRRKVERGKLRARMEDDAWMVDVRSLQALYPEAARPDIMGYLELENQRLNRQLEERERQLDALRMRLKQLEREVGEQHGMARVQALMEGARPAAPPAPARRRLWPWLLAVLTALLPLLLV